MVRSKTVVLGLFLGLVAILVVAFWPRESPANLAPRLAQAFDVGDYDAIWRAMPETERAELGLNREKFHRLMAEYIAPVLKALGSPIRGELRRGAFEQQVIFDRTYRTANGEDVHICFDAAMGENGVHPTDLTTTLVLTAMNLRHPRLKTDLTTYDQESRALLADAPVLRSFGLGGLIRYESGKRRYVTWEERLAVCNQKLAALRVRKMQTSFR